MSTHNNESEINDDTKYIFSLKVNNTSQKRYEHIAPRYNSKIHKKLNGGFADRWSVPSLCYQLVITQKGHKTPNWSSKKFRIITYSTKTGPQNY